MNFNNLLFEKKENIATVTINRPDKLNALNKETVMELGQVFDEIETDSEIKGILITGSGEKTFVAGAGTFMHIICGAGFSKQVSFFI